MFMGEIKKHSQQNINYLSKGVGKAVTLQA
jgi:hypothetical protein